jgi:hypothetical protein
MFLHKTQLTLNSPVFTTLLIKRYEEKAETGTIVHKRRKSNKLPRTTSSPRSLSKYYQSLPSILPNLMTHSQNVDFVKV